MGISKAFKLNKEPRVFQAGESTGFQLSLGSQYYDRKEKTKKWTNYKAVLFAKGNQLSFYQQSLTVGAIVELIADDLRIDMYNPEYPTIELLDARLGFIHSVQQPQQQAQPQSQTWGQQQQQQHHHNDLPDFDDISEIPF